MSAESQEGTLAWLEAEDGNLKPLMERLARNEVLTRGENYFLHNLLAKLCNPPGYGNRPASWRTIYRNMRFRNRLSALLRDHTKTEALQLAADEFNISFKTAEKIDRDWRNAKYSSTSDVPLEAHLAQIKHTVEKARERTRKRTP